MARCPAAVLIPGHRRRARRPAKRGGQPHRNPTREPYHPSPLPHCPVPATSKPPRRRHYRHCTNYTHTYTQSIYVTDMKLKPSMVFFSQPPHTPTKNARHTKPTLDNAMPHHTARPHRYKLLNDTMSRRILDRLSSNLSLSSSLPMTLAASAICRSSSSRRRNSRMSEPS